MDDTDTPTSPRKKLKAYHAPLQQQADEIAVGSPLDTPKEQFPRLQATVFSESKTVASIAEAAMFQQENSETQIVKEAEVGITEFVSPDLLGFTGILKKRYTDFIVNEILPSGEVVHLDNLKENKRKKNTEVQAPLEDRAASTYQTTDQPERHRFTDILVNETLPSGQMVLNTLNEYKRKEYAEAKLSLEERLASTQQTADQLGTLIEQNGVAPQNKQDVIPKNTGPDSSMLSTDIYAAPPEPSSASPEKEKTKIAQDSSVEPTPQVASTSEIPPDEAPSSERKERVDMQETSDGDPSALIQWQSYASQPTGFQLSSDNRDLLTSYFDTEVVDSTLALYNRILNSPHRKIREYGTVKSAVVTDRELRTKIHQAIRRIFSSRLETVTDNDGAMIISAARETNNWGTKAGGGRQNHGRQSQQKGDQQRGNPQKGKLAWQELGGEHLHFTLYKENKDTMEVISYLARQLKVKPQSFQFAGTKDRRGVTAQRVSVYRLYAHQMISVGRTLRNAKIGNFDYQTRGLELGELAGNEFIITLRDCQFQTGEDTKSQEKAEAALNIVETAIGNLRQRGFINYYGLQRFGTFSTRTDTVGVYMLQGDFKAAVAAILEYSSAALNAALDPLSDHDKISSDDKARAFAIHSFKTTGKSYPALDDLPKKFSAESNLIRHLGSTERSNDYQGALQTISRGLRMMYVHAYQSLVWNVAASERWKHFGDQVLEGDLVLVDEHKDKGGSTSKPEEIDMDGEAVVQPAAEDRATNAEDIFSRARALTKEEADSGNYTIFDLVLPTPGFDIIYPANEIGDFYKSFMGSKRGGGLDPHDMRRKWKDVSLSGSYRKLLARPGQDMSVDIKAYTKDDDQFVETDVDRLNKKHQQTNGHHGDLGASREEEYKGNDNKSEDAELKVEQDVKSGSEVEEKLAVVFKLQLGSSQYATMALRELMKLGGIKTYKPDFGGGR